jgi:hypothetical protein
MSFSGIDPARLFQILNNTGLQNKDSQLFQLLFDLIGVVTKLNNTVGSGGSGGGTGTFITQNIIQQIIEGDGGGDGGGGDFGPPGPAGLPGPMVPYFIAIGEIFNVPIFKQALFAMNIDNNGIIDVDGFLIEVDRCCTSGSSSSGGGIGFPGEDGVDGDSGLMIPVQGPQGIQGATGPSGSISVIMITEDGADGETFLVPGPRGVDGTIGINGQQGPPGFDGEPGDDPLIIPGAIGPTGLTGATGPQGPQGIPLLDTIDGEDAMMIPGIPGPAAVLNDFTKDLGAAEYSGTFDITGLSGLTVGKNVTIVQTAQPIASKGNARDEFEMDAIELTGYVVDAATIRAYWQAPSVVVGTYAFAYTVNG